MTAFLDETPPTTAVEGHRTRAPAGVLVRPLENLLVSDVLQRKYFTKTLGKLKNRVSILQPNLD
jgi:hypothetical protein